MLKRMCTSYESYELRDEDLYRNLNDEKKHFLVLMMGDFRDAMIVPEELVRRLKGEIPREIQLETPKGSSHTIVVAKNQEKRVLTVGWCDFVEIYDLHMGDSVILQYNGNSKFNAIIFDNLGREKALSVVVDSYIISGPKQAQRHTWNQIIPEEFVKRFKGEIPGEIILETKNRRIYIIRVSKHQEKLVLTAGWGTLVQSFGLQMGDTIVFRYNGNSKFHVIIFDELGRENALSVIVDPFPARVHERHTNATETVNRSNIQPQSGQVKSPAESMNTSHVLPQPMEMQRSTRRLNGPPMESSPTKRQRHIQMDKSSQGNMAPINILSSESSESFSSEDGCGVHDVSASNYNARKNRLTSSRRGQLKDGYITTSKTKLTPAEQQKVKEKVQSRQSEIPIVVAVMSKSNVDSGCSLNFPSHYAMKYLGGDPNMYLQVLGQKLCCMARPLIIEGL